MPDVTMVLRDKNLAFSEIFSEKKWWQIRENKGRGSFDKNENKTTAIFRKTYT